MDLGAIEMMMRSFKAEIINQIRDDLINTPPVSVAAPTVSLAPNIEVAACDHDVNVTMPGFEQMSTQLVSIQKSLDRLITILSAPVVKTVTRDDGLITRVEERRK